VRAILLGCLVGLCLLVSVSAGARRPNAIELENALQGGLRAVGIGTIRVSEAEQVGDLSICRVLSGSLIETGEGGGIVSGFEIGIAQKRVGVGQAAELSAGFLIAAGALAGNAESPDEAMRFGKAGYGGRENLNRFLIRVSFEQKRAEVLISGEVVGKAPDGRAERSLSVVGKAELRVGAAEHVEHIGIAGRFGKRLEDGEAFTEAAADEVGSGFGHCVCERRERGREQ